MRFVDYVMCKYSSPPTKEAAKVNESSSEIGETGWHDPSQVLINFWFRLLFFLVFFSFHTGKSNYAQGRTEIWKSK